MPINKTKEAKNHTVKNYKKKMMEEIEKNTKVEEIQFS